MTGEVFGLDRLAGGQQSPDHWHEAMVMRGRTPVSVGKLSATKAAAQRSSRKLLKRLVEGVNLKSNTLVS